MKKDNRPELLPKIVGADIEIGNFLLGEFLPQGTGAEASKLLLRHIAGTPGSAFGTLKYDPQDFGRKWLSNGSCCYIDLEHLEICLPEVRSAWDFTAAFHAQLRIVQAALHNASATLQPGVSLQALACNSDGLGSSWGSHLNFLISRSCFENIFHFRLDMLLWLASYQACSSLITGQGKVGAERASERVDYQLSQRADFFEEVVGLQTTFSRPIINCRNEALCGIDAKYARFHHISCDSNLIHTANILKVGIMQILLAMVESENTQIKPSLMLKQPLLAFRTFSHDLDFTIKHKTLGDEDLTALELQWRFFDAASSFVSAGGCEEMVPRAAEIINLWGDTLERLAARDWETLSRRLDWVLKRSLLTEIMNETPGLTWESPEIKQLDLLYGSLNPQEGLYWAMEGAGYVDLPVSDSQVQRFVHEPPSDTRAYTRAHLLRKFGSEVVAVDWDKVCIRQSSDIFRRIRTAKLDDPAGSARAQNGGLFKNRNKISPLAILKVLAPCQDVITVHGKSHAPHTMEDTSYYYASDVFRSEPRR